MKSLLITAVTFCGILFGLATTPAKAVTFDVTCTGTQTATYSPGLLFRPQLVTVNVHDILGPCKSSDRTLISGSRTITVPNFASCLVDNDPGFVTMTFVWNNGNTSTSTANRTLIRTLSEVIVVFTGIIQAGEFKGDTLTLTITAATLNVQACLAPPGVTSTSGAEVLSIVRP